MKANIEFARNNLEKLKIRREKEKEDLDEKEICLEKLRVHIKSIQELGWDI